MSTEDGNKIESEKITNTEEEVTAFEQDVDEQTNVSVSNFGMGYDSSSED